MAPVRQGTQRLGEFSAERGQGVHGLQRQHVVHFPVHQPVGLHFTERLSQHLLAEARQQPTQLTRAVRAGFQQPEQRLARRAIGLGHGTDGFTRLAEVLGRR